MNNLVEPNGKALCSVAIVLSLLAFGMAIFVSFSMNQVWLVIIVCIASIIAWLLFSIFLYKVLNVSIKPKTINIISIVLSILVIIITLIGKIRDDADFMLNNLTVIGYYVVFAFYSIRHTADRH